MPAAVIAGEAEWILAENNVEINIEMTFPP
jgi:hypothetical protein